MRNTTKITLSFHGIKLEIGDADLMEAIERAMGKGLFEFVRNYATETSSVDELVNFLLETEPSFYFGPFFDSESDEYPIEKLFARLDEAIDQYYAEEMDVFKDRMRKVILMMAVKYLDMDLSEVLKKKD